MCLINIVAKKLLISVVRSRSRILTQRAPMGQFAVPMR